MKDLAGNSGTNNACPWAFFRPNTKWVIVEHPRFGVVRGLATTEDIPKDSEILVNYHMNLGDAPEWYTKVWLRHQREFKKMSDESIERLMCR